MSKPLRLLLVEDSPDDELLVLRELKRSGFAVTHTRVQTAEAMRRELAERSWDAIISDWAMPEFDAAAALAVLRESGFDLPFIICSGTIGEEVAVHALRAGAHDFMLKSKLVRLATALDRELKEAAVRKAQRESDAEVRRLEAQVLQAQKMEAIGRLAGGVAHDFNNILTAILSTADLSLEEPGLPESLRKDLGTIVESANRGAAITRQLLAFSRKQVVQAEQLDLNLVVRNMAPMLRRLLTPGISLDIEERATGAVEADLTQLEQVLLNLVANANDAIPGTGAIHVTTSDLKTLTPMENGDRILPPGNYVVLRVRDTGTGMDEATARQIFEPFFTTKAAGKGTGLGLATVYGIVSQAHGHTFVHSRPGEGATFEICLPRVDLVARMLESPEQETPGDLHGNEVVLVVDDEATVRGAVCRVLRGLGYLVLEARNGDHALQVLEEYNAPVHLAISDVVMPEMNGMRLVEMLQGWHPHLKVLFISGYSDELLETQGVLLKGADYLPKPFTPAQLAQRVRRLLDGRVRTGRTLAASM